MQNHVLSCALFATLLTAAAACGGPDPKAPETNLAGGVEKTGTGGHEHGEHGEGGEHHTNLAPPVKAFHEVLAPLWHMEKGADRTAKTCAQGMTLREKATATGDKDLVAATTSLVTECEKEGKPEFEARFSAVHERFHAIAEAK
jgi:hypothetical protein